MPPTSAPGAAGAGATIGTHFAFRRILTPSFVQELRDLNLSRHRLVYWTLSEKSSTFQKRGNRTLAARWERICLPARGWMGTFAGTSVMSLVSGRWVERSVGHESNCWRAAGICSRAIASFHGLLLHVGRFFYARLREADVGKPVRCRFLGGAAALLCVRRRPGAGRSVPRDQPGEVGSLSSPDLRQADRGRLRQRRARG